MQFEGSGKILKTFLESQKLRGFDTLHVISSYASQVNQNLEQNHRKSLNALEKAKVQEIFLDLLLFSCPLILGISKCVEKPASNRRH